MINICVVIASFNRKNSTLSCFESLSNQNNNDLYNLSAVLFDDDSNDGTVEAVAGKYKWVEILKGNGNAYWSRGMHHAMAYAMQTKYDFILWVNDDTTLFVDAICRALKTYTTILQNTQKPIVVVGATSDESAKTITYSGQIQTNRIKKFSYKKVMDSSNPIECDVANGNFLLIPKEIIMKVGNIDPTYEHAMGDIDFSLRVVKSGYKIYVIPGFIGVCSANSQLETYNDKNLGFIIRWKYFLSKKGLPIRSFYKLTSSHGGCFWPIYFVYPYVKFLFKSTLNSLKVFKI